LLGVELVTDRDAKTPANDAADRVLYRALARGPSFKTTMGNVLTLTPPLATTIGQMEAALDIVEACLGEEAGVGRCRHRVAGFGVHRPGCVQTTPS
jgi:4-aminobutyrate aminotransferase